MGVHLARAVAVVATAVFLWNGPSQAEKPAQPAYVSYFSKEALRVDLVHLKAGGREIFGYSGATVEPVWPGPRRHLIDPIGYGAYRFRLLHAATGAEIFSQGYSSLFGEWLSTAEAEQGVPRAMSESLRFPMPLEPVTLVLEGRAADGRSFEEISRFEIDPVDYRLKTDSCRDIPVRALHSSPRSLDRAVDIVIVPDGYTERELPKMRRDARRFAGILFSYAPFDELAERIAIRLVEAVSTHSGPDEPRKGIFHDTVLHSSFDTFSSPRYLTIEDMATLRRVAGCAPYDTIMVMVNTNRYGGGGIYGTWSIFPSDSEYDEYVFIHEFGHGFAGLGDEYFHSAVGYDEVDFYKDGHEPWEPNITAQSERERIKWGDLIDPATPVPTPDEPRYDGVVGLFEGAGYKARGLFRPMRDSKMRGKGNVPFGPINERAIRTMVDYLTGEDLAR